MSDPTIALVTGANKGIGYEIAAGLGALGWTVGVGARDDGRREKAVATLRAAGADAFGVPLDVTDDASVTAAAALIQEHAGGLDVLVNNAGITGGPAQMPTTVDLAVLRTVLETNVFGPIRVTNALLPLLRRSQSPRIVNVSSSVGSLTLQTAADGETGPIAVAYSPSKSFLNAVTVQYARSCTTRTSSSTLPAPASSRPTSTASAGTAPPSRARRSRSGSRPCPTTARPARSSTTPGSCPGDVHRGLVLRGILTTASTGTGPAGQRSNSAGAMLTAKSKSDESLVQAVGPLTQLGGGEDREHVVRRDQAGDLAGLARVDRPTERHARGIRITSGRRTH